MWLNACYWGVHAMIAGCLLLFARTTGLTPLSRQRSAKRAAGRTNPPKRWLVGSLVALALGTVGEGSGARAFSCIVGPVASWTVDVSAVPRTSSGR